MQLIADAGSTKTVWSLLTRSGHSEDFQTEGINPFFQSENDIADIVSNRLLPQLAKHLWVGPIINIYFYGAGCTKEKSVIVKNALSRFFKKSEIVVDSDMVGAAVALFGKQTGVACILGTGSNSCLWSDEQIKFQVPSLGFILGDEGSGGALGKRLVADLLKNQLNEELKHKFLTENNLTQADIIERVYRQPLPNRFLASLSKFCADNISDENIKALVKRHFAEFADRILVQYKNVALSAGIEDLKFGFVGSVAYYYEPFLREVMTERGLQISEILKDPIKNLSNHLIVNS
ncbi:MAG: ATPase [Paludibacteraceae bacterium]|nr:ATPase [Paludibacteraceae bacterium]